MYIMLATTQEWCPWCRDHMGWGGSGMIFLWILILALVILVVWMIVRGDGRGRSTGDGEDRAEAVLRQQYARGEIDEETYRRRLNELRRA